ncbi:MAG TPA: adenylyl-sulfate kinase [Bryobacteraceae bacterium]|nr:adenylyl-sulfate kinase [Bryobacteraceae bacterium]
MAHKRAFAIWITGLPASGKSTITSALKKQLIDRGIDAAVLESDELRKVFRADYSPEGREAFYRQVVYVGRLLVEHGVPVIFDATANRRAYRDRARREIERFIEVFVDVPLEVCMARDPKGIYRQGASGQAGNVPGLQDEYEPPNAPEAVVDGKNPDADARRIIEILTARGYVK